MTEQQQKSIVPAPPQQGAISQPSQYNAKARELASRIKYMIVNGNRLQDAEVFALAQYAAANDLNPFAGECYYLPGSGPCPGVAGWRKKAQEQLEYEADREGAKGAHFWTEDRAAEPGETMFNPDKGDIAVFVTLHDWLSNTRWRKAIFETMRQLHDFGQDATIEAAQRFVGPEPVWTALGVVYGSEKFAADGKAEKFDRYERAKKRAEKLAIKKRFPRVNLPEPAQADAAHDVLDLRMIEPERQRLPEGQIMAELGYAPEPQPEQAEQPEIIPAKGPAIDSAQDAPKPGEMTLEEALNMTDSKGVRYGDSIQRLPFMASKIQDKLAAGLVNPQDVAAYQRKLAAIKMILANPPA